MIDRTDRNACDGIAPVVQGGNQVTGDTMHTAVHVDEPLSTLRVPNASTIITGRTVNSVAVLRVRLVSGIVGAASTTSSPLGGTNTFSTAKRVSFVVTSMPASEMNRKSP